MAAGSVLSSRTEARLRPGQQLVLGLSDRQIPARLHSLTRDCLEVAPAGMYLLRHLRVGTRMTGQVLTGDGVFEFTLSLLSFREHTALLQVIGLPTRLQRRGSPRIPLRSRAELTWRPAGSTGVESLHGVCQNVSLGGALIRHEGSSTLPPPTGPALLSLWLPGGVTEPGRTAPEQVVSAAVRVIHSWETGLRLCFVDLQPETAEPLRCVIEDRLSPTVALRGPNRLAAPGASHPAPTPAPRRSPSVATRFGRYRG